MALTVRTPAPDFVLKTKTPEGLVDVRLSDNFGKQSTVLLFYPGAFTPICSQEMCDVTASLKIYEQANAAVYGISNDTPFVLEEWAKQLKIGFPLLSDFHHEVCRSYDVVWPDFSGLGPGTARAAFVIDPSGIIRHAEQTPTLRDFPSYAAIEETVAAIAQEPARI